MSDQDILKIGVLASGRGTNLQAIINAVENGILNVKISVVISDVVDAFALERARNHGIKAVYINPKEYHNREEFDKGVIRILENEGVELVCLAGFMRILSPHFINVFKYRIMNIHPALLPSFPGLHVQKKAVDYGVKFSGCTVHFADEGVDSGPIIIQAVVPVFDNDTEDTLAERILRQEHKIYPRAIKLFANGKLKITGRKVIIMDEQLSANDESFLLNP